MVKMMNVSMYTIFYIGFRHCGKRTISVIVDYSIKSRQLNHTTVIFVVNVELLDVEFFYVFSYPSPKLPCVIPQFSGKIYSEGSDHRFCVKFNRSV